MEEDKLLPHVENLVPGFVTLACIAILLPKGLDFPIKASWVAEVLKPDIISGLIIVAFSYLIGVIVFVISRWVVDTASKWTFRWLLLKYLFERKRFRGERCDKINKEYMDTVLSKRADPEVQRRRQRGRLIRTALVPVALIGFKLDTWFFWVPLCTILVILVYAYAEVAVFREAINMPKE